MRSFVICLVANLTGIVINMALYLQYEKWYNLATAWVGMASLLYCVFVRDRVYNLRVRNLADEIHREQVGEIIATMTDEQREAEVERLERAAGIESTDALIARIRAEIERER